MSPPTRVWRWAWTAGFSTLLLAVPARAYVNPERFAVAVEQGGGGERFFTGSPADGYTCAVCHAPHEPVPLTVAGLPMPTYVPGATYAIVFDWPDNLPSVALNLEVTDTAGAPAGTLALRAVADIPLAERCSEDGSRTGVELIQTTTGRTVWTVAECGQHQATAIWQAPSAPPLGLGGKLPAIRISGSLLASNHDQKVEGDRVTDFAWLIPAANSVSPPPQTVYAQTQCAAYAPGSRTGPSPRWWLLLWLVAIRYRPRTKGATGPTPV